MTSFARPTGSTRPARISTPRWSWLRRLRRDDGYVLALTGMLLVPLTIFTAFAVDLGSWYAQGSRMQRAVDAASLAGVVQLPDRTNAAAAATASLAKNGFPLTCVVAPSTGPCVLDYPVGAGQQMTVTISASAAQYFSKIVLSSETLTRTATSIYNLRIPLGSPINIFGNDPTRAGTQPNLWAAIQGPYTTHENGDPYATKCASTVTNATTCSSTNTAYDPNGYTWGIDVPPSAVGSSMTVSIYDPAHGNRACVGGGSAPCPVGTTISENQQNEGFSTSYQLFQAKPSSVSLDMSSANGMNTLGNCTGGTPGYNVFSPGTSVGAPSYSASWYSLCTFVPSVAGVYPLRVKTSDIPSVTDRGGGWNVYSLKAVSAAVTQPSVYAIDKMSMWSPEPAAVGFTTARFYLAKILPEYAGHILQVDLFDPGDGTAGATPFKMQFLAPPSGDPSIVPTSGTPVSCDYNATGSSTFPPPSTPNTDALCNITTLAASSSSGIYNDKWLRVKVAIPSTYTCSGDCWWTVKYDFGTAGRPTDRTVWAVNVLGDPVHLTS